MFTFQSCKFLNDKIDQNNNFAKLPSAKWFFFGITVIFIIEKLRIWQIPYPDLEHSLKAALSLIKSFLDSNKL